MSRDPDQHAAADGDSRGSGAARPGSSILERLAARRGVTPRIALRGEAPGAVLKPAAGAAGKYQLQGEIARGGMGVVLRGYDTDLGRDVALKVIHDRYAERPELLQRFVEEAQIGGQLQHPGIVPVYDLGLHDGRPYFTMKLIQGRTLASLLADREAPRADQRRFLQIFEQICQTLAYAHARGVIHRDLKPANVMVGAFGEVQVVDWGMGKVLPRDGAIAEAVERPPELTMIATVRSESHGSQSMVGAVMGTPGYLPPEQARGDVSRMDERSDVFSLGAILAEILTGEPPYTGEPGDRLRQALAAELEPCRERLHACGAHPDLVELVGDCLMPAPAGRPQDASQVAQRVADHLAAVEAEAQAVRVEAAEAKGRAEEERRALRLTAGLAAAVLGMVLAIGGGWWWIQGRQAAREWRVTAQVDAALQEATLLRGQRAWAAALAAGERAKQLAEEAPVAVRTRAETEWVLVQAEADDAQAQARLDEENGRLLAALEDVRPVEGDNRYPPNWPRVDAAYETVFREQGLVLDRGDESEVARSIRDRGISSQLSAALDEWALARRAAEDAPGTARLVRIAELVDPDEIRARVRTAILTADITGLKTLAREEDLSELPLSTLNLLGRALYRGGAAEEAVTVLEPARLRSPDDFVLTLNLARALGRTRRTEEALQLYAAALALEPGLPLVHSEAGDVLLYARENESAERLIRGALDRWPEDGVLHLQLARSIHRQGRLDEAEVEYQEALRLAPESAWVHGNLAQFLSERLQLERALQHAKEAVRLDPRHTGGLTQLALLHANFREFDEGVEAADKAILLEPDVASHHGVLAVVLAKAGRKEEALRAVDEAFRLGSDEAAVYEKLGHVNFVLGRHDEAIAALRKSVELDDSNIQLLTNLSAVLWHAGRPEESLEVSREIVRRDPHSARGYATLGSALTLLARWREALPIVQEAVRLDPEYAESWCSLSNCLRFVGRYREALQAIEKGHALGMLRPDWPWPTADALAELTELVEREPRLAAIVNGAASDDPAELALAARMALDRRQLRTAIRLYREVLRVAPELGDDLHAALRYNAACGAALVIAGAAEPADAPFGPAERKALRAQALAWLRADLVLRRDQMDTDPGLAQRSLKQWTYDPDLAGVRDEVVLRELSAEEQTAWRAFWAEVHEALDELSRRAR